MLAYISGHTPSSREIRAGTKAEPLRNATYSRVLHGLLSIPYIILDYTCSEVGPPYVM